MGLTPPHTRAIGNDIGILKELRALRRSQRPWSADRPEREPGQDPPDGVAREDDHLSDQQDRDDHETEHPQQRAGPLGVLSSLPVLVDSLTLASRAAHTTVYRRKSLHAEATAVLSSVSAMTLERSSRIRYV
jgi:hypothetical protein